MLCLAEANVSWRLTPFLTSMFLLFVLPHTLPSRGAVKACLISAHWGTYSTEGAPLLAAMEAARAG